MSTNPGRFRGEEFPLEFDPKITSNGDFYQVGDQWLRADEFGNFAAGYAAYYVFGRAGLVGARYEGLKWAAARDENGDPISNEHWSDLESAPMIHAGARRADYDFSTAHGTMATRRWGLPAGPRALPLTSTAGCDTRPTSGPDPT